MKTLAHWLAWGFVASVIVYAVANPASGVVYQSPLATLGIGMIGLGLCMEARKKALAQRAAAAAHAASCGDPHRA